MRKLIVAAVLTLPMSTAQAQLRPLEPMQARLFSGTSSIAAELGGSRLIDQRASLAGENGNLWEAGNFSLAWRTGRVILEAAGTAQRFFRATSSFDDPYQDVESATDGRRHDSGDYRLSTTVRVTPNRSPIAGTVRFGTRLPTTDNTTGLDRDAVDFFATLGGVLNRRSLLISGEAGLGIHTTREQRFEQDDLLLYALRAEYSAFPLIPSITVLGQVHGTGHNEIRGVEDLGEVRVGIRAGQHYWIRAEAVKGYEPVSPSYGVLLTAGLFH